MDNKPEDKNQIELINKSLKLLDNALKHVATSEIVELEILNSEHIVYNNLKTALELAAKSLTEIESAKLLSDELIKKRKARFNPILQKFNALNPEFDSETYEILNKNQLTGITEERQKTEAILSLLRRDILLKAGWKPWYKRKISYYILISLLIALALFYFYKKYQFSKRGFEIIKYNQQWGTLQIDKSVEGNKLIIAGRNCDNGLGTHANSEIHIRLNSGVSRLKGICGVNNEKNASIQCEIKQLEQTLFKTEVLNQKSEGQEFDLAVNSEQPVNLIITDAGNGINNDHADWCNLQAY